MEEREDLLLKDWVRGYVLNMPCFPRLHVVSGEPERAAGFFAHVPNVSFWPNNFVPELNAAITT